MSIDINPEEIADSLKTVGNEYFASRKSWLSRYVENEFGKACEKYSEAIQIYPTAILYGMIWR